MFKTLRSGRPILMLHQAILDPKTSRRIFELARDQQEELDENDLDDEDEEAQQHHLSAPRGPASEDDDDLDLEQYENEDIEEIEEIVSNDSHHITQNDDERAYRKLMKMT